MAPTHNDHQAAQPGHQETHQEIQPPATPPASSRYPPGYRFAPTDCELIRDYLQKKVKNEAIPLSDIKDTYLKYKNPAALAAELPKLGENEWYFFTPRDRKYPNGGRPDRAADSGYWKATGTDKPVVWEGSTIGFRRSLVFYEGKAMQGEKTEWIMHEFTLNQTTTRPKTHPLDMRLDNWVLCRIHKKPPPTQPTPKKPTPKKVTREKKRKTRTEIETSVGVHRAYHDHEQRPDLQLQHSCTSTDLQHSCTSTDQQYYDGDHQPILDHDHDNNSNAATGQYYHGYQQPILDHVKNVDNNTGSGSGYDWFDNDNYEPDFFADLDNDVNVYLNEETAASFLPPPVPHNTNTMAALNNESAAAFPPQYNTNTNSSAADFPAYDHDQCPAPAQAQDQDQAPANIYNNNSGYIYFGDNQHHI